MFSDLTFSSLCVPFVAYHYAADNWNIGSIACKLLQYLTYVTTYVTVYTLVAVAIVRVRKVKSARSAAFDRRHGTLAINAGGCCLSGTRQVSLVVCALWIISMVANLPVFFSYKIKTYFTTANVSDAEPYRYRSTLRISMFNMFHENNIQIFYVASDVDAIGL